MSSIVQSNLFLKLLYYTQSTDAKVQMEALNSLVILSTNSNLEIASILAKEGAIEMLVNIAWINSCAKIIIMAIDGIQSLLAHGKIFKVIGNVNHFMKRFEDSNGIQTFEKLLEHPNKEIRDRVNAIKQEFFN